MIDTKAIRSKILDLAIRGKLTEQLPEDGTAEELYQQIIAHKDKLVAEGTIKKDKSIHIQESEKEKPSIPSNWKWVIFGKVITLLSGQDLKPEEYNASESGIPYLTGASNFNEKNQLIINRWTEQPKNLAVKGDILLSCKGTVGKLAILTVDRVHIARQFMAIRTYDMDVRFIEFFIQSIIDGIKKVSKGLIPGIERDDVLRLSLPLPPLAEQHRIVERIEHAFSVLDTIDVLQAQYANNLTVLKSKLIDAAIQGKLTEQLPEDGTAEELYQQIQTEKQALIKAGKIKKETPLPEISADEIPFEIPKNWKWMRLGDIAESINVGIVIRPTRYYVPQGQGTPAFRNCNIQHGFIDDREWVYLNSNAAKENPRAVVKNGDILVARSGSPGNCCVVTEPYNGRGAIDIVIVRLRQKLAVPDFIKVFLCSQFAQKAFLTMSRGVALSHLGATTVASLTVSLPPLAEQQRIVAKLEELLPLCEKAGQGKQGA